MDICGDHGCDACCRDANVTLSESDVDRLAQGGVDVATVVTTVAEYLILTHEGEACVLLKDGRCSAHAFRPDICRAFPFIATEDGTGGRSDICPHRPEFAAVPQLIQLAKEAIETQDDEAYYRRERMIDGTIPDPLGPHRKRIGFVG